MKKFKFIAFIIAVMTTMPIFQSCLDDDSPSDSLVISTINLISPDSMDGSVTRVKTGNAPLSYSKNWKNR